MLRLVSVFVIAILLAAGCGDSDADSEAGAAGTAVVDPTASAETPTPVPTSTPEAGGAADETVDTDDTDGAGQDDAAAAAAPFVAADAAVAAFIEDNDLNGASLIVVHRDLGVLHHEQWGVFDEDRVSLLASSSKMIAAGVLLHLHDEGVLDIDAPVADVVEWGSGNPDITPAQLLSNSSGLVGLLPDPAYGPYLCQFLAASTLQDCAGSIMTTADDDAEVIAPDTEFRYGGAQWQVAGAVAEAASGQTWAELIDEIYTEPCDLDVLAFNNHFTQIETDGFNHPPGFESNPDQLAPTDNPNIEGGAYGTTSDYGKLLLMHLRDGMCGDTRVLSTESLERLHGDRIATEYDGDAFSPDSGYGMGWWVDRESGRISDGGAFGSQPWLDLDDGFGVHLLTESNSGTAGRLADELYVLIEQAVAEAVAAA